MLLPMQNVIQICLGISRQTWIFTQICSVSVITYVGKQNKQDLLGEFPRRIVSFLLQKDLITFQLVNLFNKVHSLLSPQLKLLSHVVESVMESIQLNLQSFFLFSRPVGNVITKVER